MSMRAARPTGPTAEAAIAALADLASHDTPLSQDAIRTLVDWSASWIAPPPPPDLVARPCSGPAASWHLDALRTLAGDPAARVRRAYHARMLGHLLAPERDELRPLVTVLIPVYNRAALVCEAVQSCLAQDWRPLEILVVDDGSTDDPAGALARFGDVVRVLRKSNGGVASARNAGIAAARGDFIHFLDSDNLLRPDAIGAKVAAFRAVADAELCFSAAQSQGYDPGDSLDKRTPSGSATCATSDLLRAAVLRYPFFVSTTMIARWTALAAAPFEEDLRYHEDHRYWFMLGLRSTKVIGLRSRLTIRRGVPGSLSDNVKPGDPLGVVVRLRCFNDVLRDPRHWIHGGAMFARLLRGSDWSVAAASGGPAAHNAMRDVAATIEDLARRRQCDGLSILPLIGAVRHALWQATGRAAAFDGATDPMLRTCAERLTQAARAAAPISARDVAYWRQLPPASKLNHRLRTFMSAVDRALERPAELESLDWLMRRSWRIPRKRGLRRLLQWQRRLRCAWLARRLALARFGASRLPWPKDPA